MFVLQGSFHNMGVVGAPAPTDEKACFLCGPTRAVINTLYPVKIQTITAHITRGVKAIFVGDFSSKNLS